MGLQNGLYASTSRPVVVRAAFVGRKSLPVNGEIYLCDSDRLDQTYHQQLVRSQAVQDGSWTYVEPAYAVDLHLAHLHIRG